MKRMIVIAVLAVLVSAACTRIDEYESGVYKGLISGKVSDIQERGLHHALFRDWTIYDLREIQTSRRAASALS